MNADQMVGFYRVGPVFEGAVAVNAVACKIHHGITRWQVLSMTTHIIINGREITSPFVKFLFMLAAVVFASVVALLLLLLVLPLAGFVITVSLGLVVSVLVAVFISIPALIIFTALLGRFFGNTEFRIKK
ncbi:MAG: hypothetical protein OEY43_06700 [Gammaproteobacteria bacterium]|nr:hypothetical protein [Gammaproteobacteria bacterium]